MTNLFTQLELNQTHRKKKTIPDKRINICE